MDIREMTLAELYAEKARLKAVKNPTKAEKDRIAAILRQIAQHAPESVSLTN